jgi:hypothetical protein
MNKLEDQIKNLMRKFFKQKNIDENSSINNRFVYLICCFARFPIF